MVSARGGVRERTRLRVERAIAATGWTPDPAARQLAGGRGDEVVLADRLSRPRDHRLPTHLVIRASTAA